MKLYRGFSPTLFWGSLSVVLAGELVILPSLLLFDTLRTGLAVVSLAVAVAVAVAGGLAWWRLPARWTRSAYRSVLRAVARHAIAESFRQYSEPLRPQAIINREGTIALRVAIRGQYPLAPGSLLNVHNEDHDEPWGIVEVVEVEDDSLICTPIDRRNHEFWERLEERMRHDTTPPPRIYLLPAQSDFIQQAVLGILDSWR